MQCNVECVSVTFSKSQQLIFTVLPTILYNTILYNDFLLFSDKGIDEELTRKTVKYGDVIHLKLYITYPKTKYKMYRIGAGALMEFDIVKTLQIFQNIVSKQCFKEISSFIGIKSFKFFL